MRLLTGEAAWPGSLLARTIGRDLEGKASSIPYAVAIPMAFAGRTVDGRGDRAAKNAPTGRTKCLTPSALLTAPRLSNEQIGSSPY